MGDVTENILGYYEWQYLYQVATRKRTNYDPIAKKDELILFTELIGLL